MIGMGVNKVVFNTENGVETLIDLTNDGVTPEVLAEGVTAHDASGEVITGSFTLADEMSEQDSLIEQIKEALRGKAALPGTTEKWVFTLEDGTTVEKAVVIDV